MTAARAELVDLAVTRWYHCITRCVRQANLLGQGPLNRKEWVENRIEELAEIFAVSVGGYSVLDDRVHVLARLEPEVAGRWSADDVVRRWGRLVPPRDQYRQQLPVTKEWVKSNLKDFKSVAAMRVRLQSLGWFMKSFKEPIARLANKQDKVRGAFFEERYKSVAILDDESLLAVCAYIDLSPLATGIADVPEKGPHTSLARRVERVKALGRLRDLKAAGQGSAEGSAAAAGLEDTLWLCPIEDRRQRESSRRGMFKNLSLGNYLLLVNHTARVFRGGKARASPELAEILERIGISVEEWDARLEKLKDGRLFGRFLAGSRERLREVAGQLSVHHLANLGALPTRPSEDE
jgi:hypothetical protein